MALKILMAVTGILLVLFLFAHMAGNLKIFFGGATFDHYAHWLRTIGTPLLPADWYLWIQRGGLTVAVLAHIFAAVVLARRAQKARPVKYAHRPKVQGSYAARTMRWGGVIVLLFVDLPHPRPHHRSRSIRTVRPATSVRQRGRRLRAGPLVRDALLHALDCGRRLSTCGTASSARSARSASRPQRGERHRQGLVALVLSVVLVVGYLAVPFAVLTGLVD